MMVKLKKGFFLPQNLNVTLQNYEKYILRLLSKKCTVILIDCKNFWNIIILKLQIEPFFRDLIFLDGPPFRFSGVKNYSLS